MGLFSKLFDKSSEKEETMKTEPTGMREHNPMVGTSVAKDPVCGMEVNRKKAPAVFLYLGQTRYFCSSSCQRLFRGNPDKYIKGEGHQMTGHGGHHQM